MFEKILVPLDTSELSEIALPYAEQFAARLGSEITLLHVGTPVYNEDPKHAVYIKKITARVARRLRKAMALPPAQKAKVTSKIIELPGIIANPAEEILEYSEKENISLIIMATHGRTGIRRWALGSTANKVARAAKCPLLFIRAGARKRRKVSLHKMLVPLDGSKPGEAVLPYVENLASTLKCKVVLLNVVEPLYHVYPYSESLGFYGTAGVVRVPYNKAEMKPIKQVSEKYIKDIKDKLSSKGVTTSHLLRMGSPSEEIIKAGEKIHPDLVAMSTHGQSGFGRFDQGSTADKVLHGGNIPLLLVRPRRT